MVCFCTDPHMLMQDCALFYLADNVHHTRAIIDSSNQQIPIVSANPQCHTDPHLDPRVARKEVRFFGILAGNPQLVHRNGTYSAYVSVQISGICNVLVEKSDLTANYPGDMISLETDGSGIFQMTAEHGAHPRPLTSYAAPRMLPYSFPKTKSTDPASDRGSSVIGILLEQGRYPAHKAKFLLLPGITNFTIEAPTASAADAVPAHAGTTHHNTGTHAGTALSSETLNPDDFTLSQIYKTFSTRADDESTKIKSLIISLRQQLKEQLQKNADVRTALQTTRT